MAKKLTVQSRSSKVYSFRVYLQPSSHSSFPALSICSVLNPQH